MKLLYRVFIPTICILLFAFFVPIRAYAMEFRNSEGTVTVKEAEMVEGTLFAAGNTVEIIGSVDGDLICAGQSILVKGTIAGDVICAGQTIRIDGTVDGNIRVAGQSIDIEGPVTRNVMSFGQTVTFGRESFIEGDALVGGQSLSLLGSIGRSFVGGGDLVRIDGSIDENAEVGGNVIQLGENARVAGKFTYESDKDAVIETGAVTGEIVKRPMRKEFKTGQKPEKLTPKFLGLMGGTTWPKNAFVPVIFHLIIGALVVLLFKKGVLKTLETMKAHTLQSFGIGFLSMLIFLPLFILLLITIIGIPVAILYVFLFMLLSFLGKLYAALYVGRELFQSLWKDKKENMYAIVFIGVTVSWLMFCIPFIGWLLSCIATVWGMGGIIKTWMMRSAKKSAK